jgi:hypothetical protein
VDHKNSFESKNQLPHILIEGFMAKENYRCTPCDYEYEHLYFDTVPRDMQKPIPPCPICTKLEFPFSALIRREFTTGSRFCKAKLPSAVEKLSDSVPSWLPMRHREHFPSISPTLLPPHGFLVIRFAFYATSR